MPRRVWRSRTEMPSLLLSILLSLGLVQPEPEGVLLCRGEYQTEEEAKAQLARFADTYDTLEEWQTRAAGIRRAILRGAGLAPLPERNDLRPRTRNFREHEGYSVENVAFESLPGVFVTGSLYRPSRGSGPWAGILSPHGHWQGGRLEDSDPARRSRPGHSPSLGARG